MSVQGVEVIRTTWKDFRTGKECPRIRVKVGVHYVTLFPDRARYVVDAVHDICDDIEREQREKGSDSDQ